MWLCSYKLPELKLWALRLPLLVTAAPGPGCHPEGRKQERRGHPHRCIRLQETKKHIVPTLRVTQDRGRQQLKSRTLEFRIKFTNDLQKKQVCATGLLL